MIPKTQLMTDWDTDPARLVRFANERVGTLFNPANEEIPVDTKVGSIISFHIIAAPTHEGGGYYMFVLYGLVYDDEP